MVKTKKCTLLQETFKLIKNGNFHNNGTPKEIWRASGGLPYPHVNEGFRLLNHEYKSSKNC